MFWLTSYFLTFHELKYGFKVHDLMFMYDYMIFKLDGSYGIISMNYLTREHIVTSHLKIIQLIGFIWKYGHEQFNSRTSWATWNSHVIRNIISKVLYTYYSILRTWRYYSPQRHSICGIHAEFMGINNSTRRSIWYMELIYYDSSHFLIYFFKT